MKIYGTVGKLIDRYGTEVTVDNEKTKALCCEILEGGKRAFKKRQEIYNI